jgi:hypothetical protein
MRLRTPPRLDRRPRRGARGATGWRGLRALAAAGAGATALAPSQPAGADSALRLEYPASFGTIPAATYDLGRRRIGAAHLVVERLDDGGVRIFSESGFAGGARTVATAALEREGRWLRPTLQESRTFHPDGSPRGVLRIDHRRSLGSCAAGAGEGEAHTLPLPAEDRVANIPLNLFFLPLVRGDTDRLAFQLFLCAGGPRLIDFEATRAPANGSRASGGIVEIRYGPRLGSVLSFVAARFLPRLSFWFDGGEPHRWLAHRVPLYSDGPEVFVIRDGVPPRWLEDE